MLLEKPLVSIGMPIYNGEKFISEALDSLLQQDYGNFELIISDNASTDMTEKICQEYTKKDKRIRYLRNDKNIGGAENFNRLVAQSCGKYFVWASCHDLWENDFITECITVLEENPDVVLGYPQADWVDLNGNRLKIIPQCPDTRGFGILSRSNVVIWAIQYAYSIYGVIRTDILKKTKLFQKTIGPDLILLFELSLLGEFALIPNVLLHIRKMPDFGSWDEYLKKCFNRKIKGLERHGLFWKMAREHLKVVLTHVPKMSMKAGMILSVMICMLLKYRRIRCGLTKKY